LLPFTPTTTRPVGGRWGSGTITTGRGRLAQAEAGEVGHATGVGVAAKDEQVARSGQQRCGSGPVNGVRGRVALEAGQAAGAEVDRQVQGRVPACTRRSGSPRRVASADAQRTAALVAAALTAGGGSPGLAVLTVAGKRTQPVRDFPQRLLSGS
jgi:hypothetical protein